MAESRLITRRSFLHHTAASGAATVGLSGPALAAPNLVPAGNEVHVPVQNMTAGEKAAPAEYSFSNTAELGRRATALAEELSQILARINCGEWEVTVRPALNGDPIVNTRPMEQHLSPELRMRWALSRLSSAMDAATPGAVGWYITVERGEGYQQCMAYQNLPIGEQMFGRETFRRERMDIKWGRS